MEFRMPTFDLPWARRTPLQKTQDELHKVQGEIQKQVSKLDLPKMRLPTVKKQDIDVAVDQTRKAMTNGIEQAAAQLAVGAEYLTKEADELGRDAGKEAGKLTKEAAKLARQASKEAAKLSKEASRRGMEVGREMAVTGEDNLRALGTDLRALGNEVKELRITREKPRSNMMPGIALLAGLGGGLAAMYFFDPEQGRRRRALFRDQLNKWTRITTERAEGRAKDLRNRAIGTAHEVGRAVGAASAETSRAEGSESAIANAPRSELVGSVGEASTEHWDQGVTVPEGREGQPNLGDTTDVRRTGLDGGERSH